MKPYELFEILAGATWRSIERLSRNRIHLGEDAITSNKLDVLAMAAPSCVVFEDTRASEATKGCDFELWIGSRQTAWRRYAVQAKKINYQSGRYDSLAHTVAGTPQIDILERYASANRAFPVYCFYNNSAKPCSWNCTLPQEKEQLGCSVAPSSVVRQALSTRGARNFQSIHKSEATLPWRCLVRCSRFTDKSGKGHGGWPSLASATYKELPPALNRPNGRGSKNPFEDDVAGIFSSQVDLRPAWVGIIDVGAKVG